jgi:hypothetical protein
MGPISPLERLDFDNEISQLRSRVLDQFYYLKFCIQAQSTYKCEFLIPDGEHLIVLVYIQFQNVLMLLS